MGIRKAVVVAVALVGALMGPSASAASPAARSTGGFSVRAHVRVPPAVRVVETGPVAVLADGTSLLDVVLELRGDEPFLVHISVSGAEIEAELSGLATGKVAAGPGPGWFIFTPPPGTASTRVPVQVRIAGAKLSAGVLPLVFSVRTLI